MFVWASFLLATAIVSLTKAWPLPKDFSSCHNYCSAQNTKNSACVKGCEAMTLPPFSTVSCMSMCEDIYNTAGDVDACATGCNTTLGSQLPSYITISLDLVSVLSMMDSVANQAYNMAFSTTSEISVITVFTSEEDFSQWQVVQYVTNDATQDPTSLDATTPSDAHHSSCSRKHITLFTHLAVGFLFVLVIVLVMSCCTAVMESAPRTRKQGIDERLPSHLPQKITPCLPMSLNTSDKQLKGSVIIL